MSTDDVWGGRRDGGPDSDATAGSAGNGAWAPRPGERTETLLSDWEPVSDTDGHRGRRGLVVGGAVALVLGTAAAATAAVSWLSGGGTQPEDVLPGSAIAFADIDFDPSAGQKVSAARFLGQFPQLEGTVSEDADFRRLIVDELSQDGGVDVDFAADIEPWLGKRAGFAVLPPAGGGTEPGLLFALQVTDEAAARDGIAKLASVGEEAGGSQQPAVTFRDGYALLAQDQATLDEHVGGADSATLAQSSTFQADMDSVDADDSIATLWADMDALAETVGAGASMMTGGPLLGTPAGLQSGRTAVALRFAGDDVVELSGAVAGSASVTELGRGPTGVITELPASTVAAVSLTGAGAQAETAWDQWLELMASSGGMDAAATEAELQAGAAEYGFTLPEDLTTLLGESLTVALDEAGLVGAAEGSVPAVGARVVTDPDAAEALAGRVDDVLAQLGAPFRLEHRRTDDGLVLATTPEQADRLAAGDGDLGSQDAFTKVLPDADDAQLSAYVDIDALLEAFGAVDGQTEPLGSFGMTAVTTGGGTGTYRLRLSLD